MCPCKVFKETKTHFFILSKCISQLPIQFVLYNLEITSGSQTIFHFIRLEEKTTESPKKVCFFLLVHEKRELVEELIKNIQHYCPNSSIVLYNGGEDHSLCDNLNIPVCPSSRKLKYGFTTIHMIEIIEWLENIQFQYDYLINIDSDVLFVRHGYEEFISNEMGNADYMGVDFRITGDDYYCANELRKDRKRWKKFFDTKTLYGVFNVGQVMSRKFTNFLISYNKKKSLKKALLDTPAFGTDELVFVNIAAQYGFNVKGYPSNALNPTYKGIGWDMHKLLIRYRPHISLSEIIKCLNEDKNIYLCHPIRRLNEDPVRQLINRLQFNDYLSYQYQTFQHSYPDYIPSPIIQTHYGYEAVAIKDGMLTHFYKDGNVWLPSETFGYKVTGKPLLIEKSYGYFDVVAKLENGGIGHWWRNNTLPNLPWSGPTVITDQNLEPILLTNLNSKYLCVVGKNQNRFTHWVRDDGNTWKWNQMSF
jgi:hypothetical protein